MEVKNPGANRKTKTPFASVEEWTSARKGTLNTLEIDTSRVSSKPTENNGFKVPKYAVNFNKWLIWCYEMIEEADPKLLESEAVKIAYNNLVAACAKHDADLLFANSSVKGKYRYKHHLEWMDSHYYPWHGMPAILKGEARWYNPKEDPFDPIRKELVAPYKVLYDLIQQSVRAHIEKHIALGRAKKEIAYSEKKIAKLEKTIERVSKHYRNEIKRYQEVIRLNEEVLAAYPRK